MGMALQVGVRQAGRWVVWILFLALRCVEVAHATEMAPTDTEIRRTTDGIAHVRASGWRELGIGIGYVQAQDALCTLADGFLTYRGQRSRYFGAEARPPHLATYGRAKNLDLDFFFRAHADDAMLARFRAEQPRELEALGAGYAAGYNRYLAEARHGSHFEREAACLHADWVQPITAADILRRMYAAQIAAGLGHFIPEIVNAEPLAKADRTAAAGSGSLRTRLALRIGEQAALGSNMLAFGRQATGEEGAVLLGNPHWYWGGPDRFYQMHLTIPGRLDVAGVAFLGLPLVMIGFNDRVAWSHTVSAARRFGLFDLALDHTDPTRYWVDGKSVPMEQRRVSVDVRAADGSVRPVTRTFYTSRFGPMIDLGAQSAALGWGSAHALAIRDVNAENFRVFRNFLEWNQATSLDEFIAIQRREAAMPWVYTSAIGRGDGRAWFSDIGAVPNVSDYHRGACATAISRAYATFDPYTPVLDGGRSACDWQVDGAAVQPGALPVVALPAMLREDYVANMNDSYWLANVHRPLEGYAAVLGGERQALSLRGRLGHRIALGLVAPEPAPAARSAQRLGARLREAALDPVAGSALFFKEGILGSVCSAAADDDVRQACSVLQQWNGKAEREARGALLWDAFWSRLDPLPHLAYATAFDPRRPLDTPGSPDGADPRVGAALRDTVASFTAQGLALDAPLHRRRYVRSGGREIGLYGGCHVGGYFAVVCGAAADQPIGPEAVSNSYLQVVRFDAEGVHAQTLLAHGNDDTAVEGGTGSAPVERYAHKAWLDFAFDERDIASDPGLRRWVLRP